MELSKTKKKTQTKNCKQTKKSLSKCVVNYKIGGLKLIEKKIKEVEFVDKKLYGINNIDTEQLSETSEFPIGSITKLFTIISLLLLHQNKKLNIYENIGKYINNEHIKDLKIIDIINHKSGLINMYDGIIYGSSKIKYDSATQIYEKYINHIKVDEKFKDGFIYSNMGFHILGYLIEKITGIKYSDFVKKKILIPLKMNNTGIEDCNITLYNLKKKKLTKYEKWERTFASSSGELKSCVKDLIKFSKFVKLLDKQTLDILKELTDIYKIKKNDTIIGHSGGITGGNSILRINYDNNYKVKNIYISLKTGY